MDVEGGKTRLFPLNRLAVDVTEAYIGIELEAAYGRNRRTRTFPFPKSRAQGASDSESAESPAVYERR